MRGRTIYGSTIIDCTKPRQHRPGRPDRTAIASADLEDLLRRISQLEATIAEIGEAAAASLTEGDGNDTDKTV